MGNDYAFPICHRSVTVTQEKMLHTLESIYNCEVWLGDPLGRFPHLGYFRQTAWVTASSSFISSWMRQFYWSHASMPVDNKGLYLALPHQGIAGWLLESMEFYALYMKGLMLALGQPAMHSLSPTETRKMSANTHSLPRSELLEGRGCVLYNCLFLA